MTILRRLAWAVLITIVLASAFAGSYDVQHRDAPNEPPGGRFPLGTDELGRDRLARLLWGTRVSLLLAPAAALLATVLGAGIGVTAGWIGGWFERSAMAFTDLFVSLPWLFLLLTVRALLPLNTSAWMSVTITFVLLGLLGWATGARVVRAAAVAARASDYACQAHAYGCSRLRLMRVHVLPNLRPVVQSQFCVSVPVFLLTEANLGMLGLGVTEPLPSWGNLLAELANYHAVLDAPWLLAPAILLLLVLTSLHIVLPEEDTVR